MAASSSRSSSSSSSSSNDSTSSSSTDDSSSTQGSSATGSTMTLYSTPTEPATDESTSRSSTASSSSLAAASAVSPVATVSSGSGFSHSTLSTGSDGEISSSAIAGIVIGFMILFCIIIILLVKFNIFSRTSWPFNKLIGDPPEPDFGDYNQRDPRFMHAYPNNVYTGDRNSRNMLAHGPRAVANVGQQHPLPLLPSNMHDVTSTLNDTDADIDSPHSPKSEESSGSSLAASLSRAAAARASFMSRGNSIRSFGSSNNNRKSSSSRPSSTFSSRYRMRSTSPVPPVPNVPQSNPTSASSPQNEQNDLGYDLNEVRDGIALSPLTPMSSEFSHNQPQDLFEENAGGEKTEAKDRELETSNIPPPISTAKPALSSANDYARSPSFIYMDDDCPANRSDLRYSVGSDSSNDGKTETVERATIRSGSRASSRFQEKGSRKASSEHSRTPSPQKPPSLPSLTTVKRYPTQSPSPPSTPGSEGGDAVTIDIQWSSHDSVNRDSMPPIPSATDGFEAWQKFLESEEAQRRLSDRYSTPTTPTIYNGGGANQSAHYADSVYTKRESRDSMVTVPPVQFDFGENSFDLDLHLQSPNAESVPVTPHTGVIMHAVKIQRTSHRALSFSSDDLAAELRRRVSRSSLDNVRELSEEKSDVSADVVCIQENEEDLPRDESESQVSNVTTARNTFDEVRKISIDTDASSALAVKEHTAEFAELLQNFNQETIYENDTDSDILSDISSRYASGFSIGGISTGRFSMEPMTSIDERHIVRSNLTRARSLTARIDRELIKLEIEAEMDKMFNEGVGGKSGINKQRSVHPMGTLVVGVGKNKRLSANKNNRVSVIRPSSPYGRDSPRSTKIVDASLVPDIKFGKADEGWKNKIASSDSLVARSSTETGRPSIDSQYSPYAVKFNFSTPLPEMKFNGGSETREAGSRESGALGRWTGWKNNVKA